MEAESSAGRLVAALAEWLGRTLVPTTRWITGRWLLSDDPAHCWEQELVVAPTDKETTQALSVGRTVP